VTAVVTAFIDGHRDRFGVEPICRVLTEHGCPIAPSTYYAARHRPPSPRASRDELVLIEIRRVHTASGGRYGARKVYHQLPGLRWRRPAQGSGRSSRISRRGLSSSVAIPPLPITSLRK